MEEEKPCSVSNKLPIETTENVLEKEKVMKEFLVNIKEASLGVEEINVLQLILENFKNMTSFKSDGSCEDDGEFKTKKDKKSADKIDLSVNEPEDDMSCAKFIETKQTNEEAGKEPKSEENSLNGQEEIENCHSGQLMVKTKKAYHSDLNKLHDDIEEIFMNEKIMSLGNKYSMTEEKIEEDNNEAKDELPKRILKMMVEKSERFFCENRKKIRKRKNMWTSGITQKKARKEDCSSKMKNEKGKDDEKFELSGHIEHDKQYFFVHSAEISCKLCSFKGKLIVQHYKTSHPESEVLISRINPNITEILIGDAIRNREEYEKDHPELEKMTCNFKCPFCLMLIKDTVSTYYNHISSHTGEYCFQCNRCSYWTYNHTNIHSHLNQMHYKIEKILYKMVYLDPKISKYVFGYICSECNFIQLIQTTVEEHAMIYHPGKPKIYRVNLGMLLYNDDDESHMNEIHSNENYLKFNCINAVMSSPIETHNHNLKIPAEANVLTNLLVQMEAHEEVKVKIESKNLDNDSCPIELATFIHQPDLDIKQDSESNRIEMLQWIEENERKPSDQLQTKLVTEIVEESEKVQIDMPSSIPFVMKDEEEVLSFEMKLPVIASLESLTPKTKDLMSTSEDDSKCVSVLTDILMTDIEKQNRKCPKAIAVMMKPPLLNALYKCPKYNCSFVTPLPLPLQKHFTTHHSILMDTLVPCLYCDYKVSCNSYVTHLEVRHGHCLFGCGNCFYRTTNSYFVTIHHELTHPNIEVNILQLEVVTSNRTNTDTTPVNFGELMSPYNCKDDGFLSCSFNTLYFDQYLKHVETIHQVNGLGSFSSEHEPQKEAIMEGWLAKGVGPFQCRYCKKATVTHQEMGRHQAVFHTQEQCLFYYRKFVPNDNVIIPEQVNLKDPSFINHVIHLPSQAHLCDFKLTDGLLSSTSAKLTNGESESLLLLSPPTKDNEIDSDQSSVSLDEPEPFNVLVNDEASQLDVSDSLGHDKQPKNGSAHTNATCKWKGCYQTYNSQSTLGKHIEKNHLRFKRGEEFICFWINCSRKLKPFATKQYLSIHMRTHSGEKPHKCPFEGCDKAFSQPVALKTHERRHTGERPYLCQFSNCFKSFTTKYIRDNHQMMHYDPDAYACQVTGCSKKYADPGSLQKHLRKHTVDEQFESKQKSAEDKKKEADFVLKKSSNRLDRDKQQRTHYDSCKWKGCHQTYHSQIGLVKHIEKNHVRVQSGKKFTCFWTNCPRKSKPCTSKQILSLHMRSHTGEKPYKCSFQGCNKAFSHLIGQKTHERRHTGKRPYLCQFSNCLRSFSTSFDRDYHQKMHYDPEASVCQDTSGSKKCADSSSLQKYMKNHAVDEHLQTKWKSVENKEKEGDSVLKKSSKNLDKDKHQKAHYDTCKWKGCHQTYDSQMALVKHIEKDHVRLQKGEEVTCFWINCPRKMKPYARMGCLLMHIRAHIGEKRHKCPFQDCKKTFLRLDALKAHQRTHTGEKPYLCQFPNCLKSFSVSFTRDCHQRMHYDPEAYACPVIGCSKKYAYPNTLQIHMKSHTIDEQLKTRRKSVRNKQKKHDFVLEKSPNSSDEVKHQRMHYITKPYVCQITGCSKKYADASSLSKHMENHIVDKDFEVKQKSVENEQNENDFIVYHL